MKDNLFVKVVKLVIILIIIGAIISLIDKKPEDQQTIISDDLLESGKFSDVLDEIIKLDKKYETSFWVERINVTMVDQKTANAMMLDLKELRKEIEESEHTNETEISLMLIDARIHMLLSQKYLRRAEEIGPKGLAWDGFKCTDFPNIRMTYSLLNKTVFHTQQAVLILDTIMQTQLFTRDLIGVDDNKPAFFSSILDGYTQAKRENKDALENYCKDQNT